ncbi:hypothetical protein HS041_06675 [Planomonospora sp. ID67723]|uniref:hypothetical protein n=1 Tax=Planomonospora sp. ID67723 TaxID=2738134 RepID=UPI0018C42400|nr:hypothetical protein [Planomonospora sp. ID67723]MBG0827447.1 hypothetical protein [Planomonospora sp. ID67723]
MDLLGVIRAVRRRWILALALLLVTVASVTTTMFLLPWTYEARANVVFLSSQQLSKEAGGNPYLYFDSSLKVTAEIVSRSLMSERQGTLMKEAGLTAIYKVALAPDSVGPLLDVVTEASDPRAAQATLTALLAAVPKQVDALQSNLPSSTRVRTNSIMVTTEPELKPTQKIRIVAVVAAFGLVLCLAVPAALEASAERRRTAARRAKAAAAPPDPDADLFLWRDAPVPAREPARAREEPARAEEVVVVTETGGTKVAGERRTREDTGKPEQEDSGRPEDDSDDDASATVTFALPWLKEKNDEASPVNGDGRR